MLLEKFNADGVVAWSQHWICNSCYAAFGVDLTVSNNYVYLTGVGQSSPANLDFDIVVQKYNAATGQLIWTRGFDNNSPTEFPIDILVNSTGTVFVAGTTKQAATAYNMFIASISSTGVINWQQQYDYAGFDETAVQLRLSSSYAIQLLGASSTNAANWEAALLSYDPNGVLVNTLRSGITGLDKDLPLSYHFDNNDLYIGGSKMNTNTSNVDAYLQKYEIGSSFNQIWETPVDVDGRMETISGIKTTNNNLVMATGGTANENGDTWTWIQQFSAMGSPVWRKLRAAAPAEDIISCIFRSI
jgi:outer membrane protein assembly factor BamB